MNLIKPPIRRFPQSVFSVAQVITARRPDLVITNNWGSMDAVLAAAISRGCPVIHSEDGFGPDEAVSLKWRRVFFRRMLLNRICTTVVPSKTLLRIAHEQFRLSGDKVTYIPNGIDVRAVQRQRDSDLMHRLGADAGAFVVGFIGHLRREKALHVLLQAFAEARLPNARLVLVGDGPCRKELADFSAELGIAKQVHFAGHIQDPGVYLAAFDLLAMSTATEQMPMAILEAMAFGLPVVSTNVGDCAEILGTYGPPFIVPSGNVPAYAGALQLLAASPEMRHRVGAENRKRCIELYSFDAMVKSYTALYERVLRSPIPQPDAASGIVAQ